MTNPSMILSALKERLENIRNEDNEPLLKSVKVLTRPANAGELFEHYPDLNSFPAVVIRQGQLSSANGGLTRTLALELFLIDETYYNMDYLGGATGVDLNAVPFKATRGKNTSRKVVTAETLDKEFTYWRGVAYFSVHYGGTIQPAWIASPHDGGGTMSREKIKGSANLLMMDGHVENVPQWLRKNTLNSRLNWYDPLKSDYTD